MILDIVGEIVYYLFGALAGVLYPPKSREWAQWQRCGLILGLAALVALSLGAVLSQLSNPPPVAWPLVVIGMACAVGYVIVGNVCRTFHEGDKSPSEEQCSEREARGRVTDKYGQTR